MPSNRCSALIVVDMQNDFLATGGYYDRKAKLKGRSKRAQARALRTPSRRRRDFSQKAPFQVGFVKRIARSIAEARRRGWPIVLLRAVYGSDFGYQPWFLIREPKRMHYPCKRGTWGAELVAPIARLVARCPRNRREDGLEIVLEKHTFDGFCDTGLAAFLSRRGVRHAVFVGIETHVCVLSTAVSSACGGLATTILRDCVATATTEMHEPALALFDDAFGKVSSLREVFKGAV